MPQRHLTVMVIDDEVTRDTMAYILKLNGLKDCWFRSLPATNCIRNGAGP